MQTGFYLGRLDGSNSSYDAVILILGKEPFQHFRQWKFNQWNAGEVKVGNDPRGIELSPCLVQTDEYGRVSLKDLSGVPRQAASPLHPSLDEAERIMGSHGTFVHNGFNIEPVSREGYTVTGEDRYQTLNEALWSADQMGQPEGAA